MEPWVVAFILTFVGLFLSAYLIWYYFLTPRKPVQTTVSRDGIQRIHIEVHNGYHPSTIRAQAGRRLTLRFYRIENSPCSEEVVLPDFGIRQHLNAFETTAVDLVPFQPGEYSFTCGDHIQKGTLIVQ